MADKISIALYVIAIAFGISALVVAILAYNRSDDNPSSGTEIEQRALVAIAAQQQSASASAMYAAKKEACVTVISTFSGRSKSFGSGFLIDIEPPHGIVVTCAHAVLEGGGTQPGAHRASRIEIVVGGLIQTPCAIVGIDASADVAVLRTVSSSQDEKSGHDFQVGDAHLGWGDSDATPPGSPCYVIGNPLGGDFASMSSGIVRDNKYIGTFDGGAVESMYCSAPIAGGNSGSPILDARGDVIGMSCWVSNSRGAPLENFVGGANQTMLARIVERLRSSAPEHIGYLGVSSACLVAGVTLSSLRDKFPEFAYGGNDKPTGIYFKALDGVTQSAIPGSRLVHAGVKAGDILLSIDGISVGAFDEEYSPTRITWFAEPGSDLSCTLLRPSENRTFMATVTVDDRPHALRYVFTGGNAHF